MGWASRSSRRATPPPAARSSRFASTMPGPVLATALRGAVVADHRAPDLIRVAPKSACTSSRSCGGSGRSSANDPGL